MLRTDGHPVVAATLDVVMAPMARLRRHVVPDATGRVLEVGFGTGLNLAHYDPHRVSHLVAVEPDPHMRRRAEARIATAGLSVELLDAEAASLPFGDGTFDTVVLTWVLCSVPDPDAAAAELFRVLAPGGLLRFAEHTRSASPALATAQRWLTPAWRHLAGGCHLDRDTLTTLRRVGFVDLDLVAHPRGGRELIPTWIGTARKPAATA